MVCYGFKLVLDFVHPQCGKWTPLFPVLPASRRVFFFFFFLRFFVLHPGTTPLGNDPEWFKITRLYPDMCLNGVNTQVYSQGVIQKPYMFWGGRTWASWPWTSRAAATTGERSSWRKSVSAALVACSVGRVSRSIRSPARARAVCVCGLLFCWETFHIFAYCGLVVEIQPLSC